MFCKKLSIISDTFQIAIKFIFSDFHQNTIKAFEVVRETRNTTILLDEHALYMLPKKSAKKALKFALGVYDTY